MLGVSPVSLLVVGTSLQLAIPCNPRLVGKTVAFLGVEQAPAGAGGLCTAPFPLRLTDTLLVTLQ